MNKILPLQYTVADVIRKVSKRLGIYSIAIAFMLGLSLIILLGHQTNSAVCKLVQVKLASIKGPLSREILLNNTQGMTAIIRNFNDELRQAHVAGKIILERYQGYKQIYSPNTCQVKLFSVHLFYPVEFSRKLLATIEGNPHYVPEISFWIVLILAMLGFALVLRSMIRILIKEIENKVIIPVRLLSLNEPISKLLTIPNEVLEIDKNIEQLKSKIANEERSIAKAKEIDQLAQLASQTAHDIRSPLSALNVVASASFELPEEKRRLIRNACQRINDIANGLLTKSKNTLSMKNNSINKDKPVLMVALLDSIISEKRVEFRHKLDLEINGNLQQGYGLFAAINASEFSRVISNLINNSVEAISEGGQISIEIKKVNTQIHILLTDNGRGIAKSHLDKIGQQGISFGKKEKIDSGNGLGLYHAIQAIERVNGQLKIQSEVGLGTTITLIIPSCPAPGWFLEDIILLPHATFVSVDDDLTIHQVWSGRLTEVGAAKIGCQHMKFSMLQDFTSWLGQYSSANDQYFIDYEFLGHAETGLMAIERLNIAKQAVLVTSRFEELLVQEKAMCLGIKILPKTLANLIPIGIAASKTIYDAILIDDDALIHQLWMMVAADRDKKIICFEKPDDFFGEAKKIHLNSPVYIDVNLADGIRGQHVALQISNLGFQEIHLATGYEAESVEKPHFIRSVTNKDFPLII